MKSANFSELMDIPHIGWMLMHSVWQASAIAAALWIVMFLLRGKSARLRYALACGAMVLALISPVITVWWTMPAMERSVSGVEVIPVAQATSPAMVLVDASGEVLSESPLSFREQIERHLPSVVKFWIACVVVLSIRLGIGFGRTRAWKSDAYLIVDDRWTIPLKRVIVKMNLPRRVMLLQSMRVNVPMTIGWFSPVILIPASLASGLSPLQIQGILAHELAHIRRHDYLVNLVQTAIETLMFYHPAIGWMGSVIRQERENCCDDIASEIVGDSRAYAQTLIRVEELCHMKNELSLALTGGVLLPRIQRLLGVSARQSRLNGQLASFITLVLCAVIAGCAMRASGETQPPATTESVADTIQPGDLLDVQWIPLQSRALPTVLNKRVNPEGTIDLPLVGRINVAGLRPDEASQKIQSEYNKRVDPSLVVVVRLLPPKAPPSTLVEAAIQQAPAEPPSPPAAPELPRALKEDADPELTKMRAELYETVAADMKSYEHLQALQRLEKSMRDDLAVLATQPTDRPAGQAHAENFGKIAAQVATERKRVAEYEAKVASLEKAIVEYRIAKERRNAVIEEVRQPNKVEVRQVGEYYISGDIQRPGVYSLNDRKISILQAIIATGTDPAAMPDAEVQIIRRIEGKKTKVLKFTVKALYEQNRGEVDFVEFDDTILIKAPGIRKAASTTQAAMNVVERRQREVEMCQHELRATEAMLGVNHPSYLRAKKALEFAEGRLREVEPEPRRAATQPSN